MIPYIIIIALIIYFCVAIDYAIKVDNVLYFKYGKNLSMKNAKPYVIYCCFWLFFFKKLDDFLKENK